MKADSPLKDTVSVGDVIVKIDNDNALNMSAAGITAYMIKTKDRTRILTVGGNDSAGLKNIALITAAETAPKETEMEAQRTNDSVRIVQVPPGRLGIVIDTTPSGPVVSEVNTPILLLFSNLSLVSFFLTRKSSFPALFCR